MRILLRIVTTAVALAAAAWLIDGIRFTGARDGMAEVEDKIVPLLLVAAILALVTSVVKPILTFISIPLIILTLGLFLLVINAVLLLLVGELAEALDIGFRVRGFWSAVGGSIVITVVTWLVDALTGGTERRPKRARR